MHRISLRVFTQTQYNSLKTNMVHIIRTLFTADQHVSYEGNTLRPTLACSTQAIYTSCKFNMFGSKWICHQPAMLPSPRWCYWMSCAEKVPKKEIHIPQKTTSHYVPKNLDDASGHELNLITASGWHSQSSVLPLL